ncbi:MAG TPA: MoaD/ThiS family protein [Acidobacteriaceae bacterium]|jgi:adenylyltransferase/sulfurtransferase|nr:MoaD/ThiS family protein [Acidobacteriaceae bacterium]
MKIDIPASLRVYAGNLPSVTVNADTVSHAITTLFDRYPEFRKHLYTSEGKLRSFVNLYLNDEDVRYLPAREDTEVKESDRLSIIPSIAGGADLTESHERIGICPGR